MNTAIAKVPATIASVEVPGGTGASDEAKRAAVKAYIENQEGMAALGVTITIDAGSQRLQGEHHQGDADWAR